MSNRQYLEEVSKFLKKVCRRDECPECGSCRHTLYRMEPSYFSLVCNGCGFTRIFHEDVINLRLVDGERGKG